MVICLRDQPFAASILSWNSRDGGSRRPLNELCPPVDYAARAKEAGAHSLANSSALSASSSQARTNSR
jgi:hypothetical protein